MSGLIVVGLDGSDGSMRALEWAIDEAGYRDAKVRAIMAWSYLDQPAKEFDPRYGEEDARRQLDKVLSSASGNTDVVEGVLVNDLPTRALLDAASDADLVVVGSRGLGGFRGLLLGSVSLQIAQHAPCPVVIIPGEERQHLDADSGAPS